ncbi:MAG: type II toxin-antitoxin system RelE/ParE family toxin [Terriglobia bacterium]
MPIIKRRTAATDLLEHFVFIGQSSEDAAQRFLRSAEETFQLLASQPEMGKLAEHRSPLLAGVRRFPVKDFPKYLIFYRPIRDGIEVVRVIHGARDIPALFET